MLTRLDCYNVVKNTVGSRIVLAQYSVHTYENVISVISVNMTFENGKLMNVQCSSDGESLRITQESPYIADLESFGQISLVNASEFDPASLLSCLGNNLQCVTLETRGGVPKALRMDWGGCKVFFANLGDTLNFEEACFKQMIADERWERLSSVTFKSK